MAALLSKDPARHKFGQKKIIEKKEEDDNNLQSGNILTSGLLNRMLS